MQRVSGVSDARGVVIDTQAVRAECQARLDAMVKQSSSVSFACLSTVDGRLFAYSSAAPTPEPQHRSAITSSLLALSESFAKESLRSRCAYTVVAAEHGVIVAVRVPSKARSFALSVGADSSDILALTLRMTLDASDALAKIIDRSE
jgi:predicted regulator of Ras-like GTPase activity (Roadblock/LC7/MglB family)